MSIKFVGKLKEIRIHLCQTSLQSKGLRDFVQHFYVKLKTANPAVPILIRECSGVQPRIWVRYEKGVERTAAVTNQEADDILNTLKQLNK